MSCCWYRTIEQRYYFYVRYMRKLAFVASLPTPDFRSGGEGSFQNSYMQTLKTSWARLASFQLQRSGMNQPDQTPDLLLIVI